MIGQAIKKENQFIPEIAEIELNDNILKSLKEIHKVVLGKSKFEIIKFLQTSKKIQDLILKNRICYLIKKILKEKHILKIRYEFDDVNIPMTPFIESDEKEYHFFNELLMIFVSMTIGKIVKYDKEKNGKYIHNVFPIRNKEHVLTDQGSAVDLGLHIEIASEDDRPDYLILSCLRQSLPPTPTVVARISEAITNLKNEDIEVLKKDFFLSRPPRSFGENFKYRIRQMIDESTKKFYFNFNEGMVIARNIIAERAFLNAKKIFERVKFPVYLFPGEILILNNNQVVHGRANYKANFDGTDRWMQRAYVKQ